jgi:hypothetical protein
MTAFGICFPSIDEALPALAVQISDVVAFEKSTGHPLGFSFFYFLPSPLAL